MRNPEVLVQIQEADALLLSSGVRDHCIECIHSEEGGCCQHCDLLGKQGCTNKPLACALWLCDRAQRMFPAAAKKLDEMKSQWPYVVSNGFRHRSLQAEAELVEVTA